MNNLFPPELRTASTVHRWSIVRTFQKDTTAEHSFYVAFYAVQIAKLIKWQGPLADLQFYASMHDIEETISGDILGPVKREIVDEGRFEEFMTTKMAEHLPGVGRQMMAIKESMHGSHIKAIVKVADKVDAVLFLISEIGMGNVRLERLLTDALKNLRAAWDYLYEINDYVMPDIDMLWTTEIWPAIQSHYKYGGVGLL